MSRGGTEVGEDTIQRVVEFHGHMSAGLAMGIRAAEVGLAEIGPHAGDEDVVAVVETDMCGVDAVQVLTGCTFGKGNLVHRDHGKNAYTFIRRSEARRSGSARVRGSGPAATRRGSPWSPRSGPVQPAPRSESSSSHGSESVRHRS